MSDEPREEQTQTRVLEETQQGPEADSDESSILSPGSRLDRYIVNKCIGTGGMGVVLEAHDPKLDRKVALKVLHSWSTRTASTEGRTRLIREAQAMAKLSHAHVVPVFDVGEHEGRVFVAMELVDGDTLDVWLRRQSPSADRIHAVFVQAARGLSAAHDAGFAHRDFKPSNLMVTPADRALVMDFGLARVVDPEASAELSLGSESASSSLAAMDVMATSLTREGAVMGTPAYMAPEQHMGDKPDHRADQFSFCATLWEALQGKRAFAGASVGELARRKVREGPQTVADRPIPRAVAAVLRRGMSPHPDDRFASMGHLVRALQRARRPRRGWIAGGLLGLVAVGATGAVLLGQDPESELCDAGRDRMDALWNDERKATLAASFDGTTVAFAGDAWRSASERVDAYTTEWEHAHRSACESSDSAQGLDRTMACLARAESALAATLDRMADVDTVSIRHVVEDVVALPPIARCTDPVALGSEFDVSADPQRAESIAQIRATLDAARAGLWAGRAVQVRAEMENALARARALEFAPLTAEVLVAMGRVESEVGEHESAKARLLDAVSIAEGAGADEIAARASISLMRLHALFLVDFDVADEWARNARVWIDRGALERGALGNRVQAQLERNLGILTSRKGDGEQAEVHYRRSYELVVEEYGEEHPEVVLCLLNLSSSAGQRGLAAESLSYGQQAQEIAERVFGKRHPRVADALGEIAVSHAMSGDFDQAKKILERALSIREEVYGPDDPKVAAVLGELAHVMSAQGLAIEARTYLKRTLAIYEGQLGESPDVGVLWRNLGGMELDLHNAEEALRCFDRALAYMVPAFGEEHVMVLSTQVSRGLALASLGRHDEARQSAEAAVGASIAAVGRDHPTNGINLTSLGYILAEGGDYEGALVRHHEALVITEALKGPVHPDVATTRYDIANVQVELSRYDEALEQIALSRRSLGDTSMNPAFPLMLDFLEGRARWGAGEHAAGRRLAEQALAKLEEHPSNFAVFIEDVEQWLREHPLGGG